MKGLSKLNISGVCSHFENPNPFGFQAKIHGRHFGLFTFVNKQLILERVIPQKWTQHTKIIQRQLFFRFFPAYSFLSKLLLGFPNGSSPYKMLSVQTVAETTVAQGHFSWDMGRIPSFLAPSYSTHSACSKYTIKPAKPCEDLSLRVPKCVPNLRVNSVVAPPRHADSMTLPRNGLAAVSWRTILVTFWKIRKLPLANRVIHAIYRWMAWNV